MRLWSRLALVTGALVAGTVLMVPVALASAQTTTVDPPVTVAAAAGFDAKSGWVSDASLASTPGLQESLGIATAGERRAAELPSTGDSPGAAGTVTPNTSSEHCSGNLCAQVFGTGLTVVHIHTTLVGNYGCINPVWLGVKGTDYANGDVARSAIGTEVCSSGPGSGTYYYNFTNQVPDRMPYTFPGTGRLGVFWTAGGSELIFRIYK